MANQYEFGIGITADDTTASKAIGNLIGKIGLLENSMDSLSGVDLSKIFGKFDPTLLMPDNKAINDIADSVRAIGVHMGALPATVGQLEDEAKSVKKEFCAVVDCVDGVGEAVEEVGGEVGEVGGILDQVVKKTKDWAAEMEKLSTKEHFGRIKKAADLLSGSGSHLRNQMTRLNRSMGDSALEADNMAAGVLNTANASKVAWEEVSSLQAALVGAGIEFDKSGKAGDTQMKTMVLLKESFNLTDHEVQRLAGTMKATGNSLTDLTGVGVAFQKQFKVPGLINTLPDAAEAAMKAQGQFGSLVGTSSRDISVNILRMTGVYSKALGVTASEAAAKARSTFMKFTAEVESFEDLFLGLADDFSPLQTAFLETGVGMDDLERLMRKGAEAPEEFAAEVRGIAASLDPQMSQRFLRQVLRNVDETTAALITQTEAQKNAQDAAGKGQEPADPSATFMKIAEAMRENAVDADKMNKALRGVANETAKMVADEGIRQGLEDINTVMQIGNQVLIGGYQAIRNNEAAYLGLNTAIRLTTAALEGLNVAGDFFGKIWGNAAIIAAGVASAGFLVYKTFKLIGGRVLALSSRMSKLTGSFKGFRAIVNSVGTGALNLLKGGFSGLGKILMGIIKGPFKLLSGVFRAILYPITAIKGGLGFLGSAFKGIGKILYKIIGKAGPIGLIIGAFSGIYTAITGIADVLSDPTKTGWEAFHHIVGAVMGGIWDFLDTFMMGIPSWIAEMIGMTGSVADAVTEIGVWVGEGLQAMWEPVDKYLITPLGEAVDWIGGKIGELFGWIGKIASEFGSAFMLGVGDITEWLTETFPNAAATMSTAYKEAVSILGLGDEAERLEELEKQTAAAQASAQSDLAKKRAGGSAPSEVDIKAGQLLQKQLAKGGAGTQDLDYLMEERTRTMSAAQRAAQNEAIEKASERGFVGASAKLIEAAALKKAFDIAQSLKESDSKLSIDIAKKVMKGKPAVAVAEAETQEPDQEDLFLGLADDKKNIVPSAVTEASDSKSAASAMNNEAEHLERGIARDAKNKKQEEQKQADLIMRRATRDEATRKSDARAAAAEAVRVEQNIQRDVKRAKMSKDNDGKIKQFKDAHQDKRPPVDSKLPGAPSPTDLATASPGELFHKAMAKNMDSTTRQLISEPVGAAGVAASARLPAIIVRSEPGMAGAIMEHLNIAFADQGGLGHGLSS